MESKTVNLSLSTILRECSLNPNLERDHFYYFSLTNRENIHQVFKYKKFNDDFTDYLSCFSDGKNIIGTIRPCYEEFLDKLLTLLNIRHNSKTKDDEELTKKMLERVEVLKKISTMEELRLEFPFLYRDLIDGRKYYDGLQTLRRQEKIDENNYASGEHYYYSCALKKSLPNFISTQSLMYERFITKRCELKERQLSTSYNNYLRKNFNLAKLYMYVMHEYLRKCESTTDKNEIKKYLALLERYLSSNVDKTVSITTNEGLKIDFENIQKRIENQKKIIAEDSSLLDWVLIPEGRVYNPARQEQEPRTTLFNQEELERLRTLGEMRTNFYETTPYIAKAIGLRRYRGYIAYIYENGEVILDCEYNKDRPKHIKDKAIYHLNIVDFESLSKLDKQVLMRHPRVGRIYHSKTWQQRAKKLIEREATQEEKETTKRLMKKLKEKNE